MLLVIGFILSAALHLLLGILLLFLFILLLVLFIPFTYLVEAHRHDGDERAEGKFGWLYGLGSMVFTYEGDHVFSMRLMILSRWPVKSFNDLTRSRQKAPRKEKASAAKKKVRRKFRMTVDKFVLLKKSAINIVKRMLPRQIGLDCRIGFENPAHTGLLCAATGMLQPVSGSMGNRCSLRFIPVFDDAELSGHIRAEGHIMIWFIVWEALKLAISRPFRQDIFGRGNKRVELTGGGTHHV
jgi:hypothetical protein